jgi:capsular polysaccharide biosynthesis protein
MYTLSNAIVHGEQGIVTAGDLLVDETLHFANPGLAGIERVAADIWELDDRTPDVTVDVAAHLMHGYVGNRNYAHWWVDVVPALLVPPFHAAFEGASLLWPQLRAPWQTETLALLPEAGGRSIFVGEHARIACRELRYVPKIMDSDLTPHPFRAAIIGAVKERGGWRGEHGRKIYITRRDASARRLLNEEAAIELLEDQGFEAVTLTGMRVSEQIKLFASASHVVGAHGAGLGNIMFCPQGAVLCEFQMMSNVQWSIRCLAAVTRMHYGCIMGKAEDDNADVNRRNWTINLDDLQAVLQSPSFQEPTMS